MMMPRVTAFQPFPLSIVALVALAVPATAEDCAVQEAEFHAASTTYLAAMEKSHALAGSQRAVFGTWLDAGASLTYQEILDFMEHVQIPYMKAYGTEQEAGRKYEESAFALITCLRNAKG